MDLATLDYTPMIGCSKTFYCFTQWKKIVYFSAITQIAGLFFTARNVPLPRKQCTHLVTALCRRSLYTWGTGKTGDPSPEGMESYGMLQWNKAMNECTE